MNLRTSQIEENHKIQANLGTNLCNVVIRTDVQIRSLLVASSLENHSILAQRKQIFRFLSGNEEFGVREESSEIGRRKERNKTMEISEHRYPSTIWFNSQLFTVNGAPLKFYLDGYGPIEFGSIVRIIEASFSSF